MLDDTELRGTIPSQPRDSVTAQLGAQLRHFVFMKEDGKLQEEEVVLARGWASRATTAPY